MPRPLPITLVSIVVIVIGVVTLAAKVYIMLSPEALRLLREFSEAMNAQAVLRLPAEFHFAHGLIGSIVWIVSGWYMLKGRNWARWLSLFWGLTVLLLTFFVAGFSLALYLKSLTYGCLAYLLSRRTCMNFFRAPSSI